MQDEKFTWAFHPQDQKNKGQSLVIQVHIPDGD